MSKCLSLPLYPEMTEAQVDYVADTLAELLCHQSSLSSLTAEVMS